MTPAEAVAALEVLAEHPNSPGRSPATNHQEADVILVNCVPPEVRAAYEALIESQSWWAFA